jgi:glycosyltransferase involved in cell wall biosynthesis
VKILISAYACEPGQGSEPGVGWNFVNEMSHYHELWILTQSDGRQEIERELKEYPNPNVHFFYIDPFGWKLDLWKAKAEIQVHYYLWQIFAYFLAQKLNRQINFDLVHHVTFVKYWSPSFLSMLPIPFLWGPVGGGESAPKPFWKDFGLRGKIYESLRALAQRLGEADPFTKVTARRSVLAQATTDDTAKRLYYLGAPNVSVHCGVGMSHQDLAILNQCKFPTDSQIRFISIGRFLHWKGFHLSLKAFIKADLPHTEYWVIGDGPERGNLIQIASKSKVEKQIKFLGKMPRAEVLKRLADCHVMVHPSLHDSGGWACLEAMATGRPVICLDLGGPALQITKECGIKIQANNPESAINAIAKAMSKLADDKEMIYALGQNARKRVENHFSWSNKVEITADLYEKLVNEKLGTHN